MTFLNNTDWFYFEGDDGEKLSSLTIDLPAGGEIASATKYITYYIQIPEFTEIGEYNFNLIVSTERLEEEVSLIVNVEEPGLIFINKYLNYPLAEYYNQICLDDLEMGVEKIPISECQNIRTIDLKLTPLYLLIFAVIFGTVVFAILNYRKRKTKR
jgi:hypothetical protein